MSKITITESEDRQLATFDASENCVLVPLMWYSESEEDAEIAATRYTSAETFKTDFDAKTEKLRKVDKTYTMIYELLLQGLTVVVKPIKLTSDDIQITTVTENDLFNELSNRVEDGLYTEFKSKNLFNIKFITSGAFMNFGKRAATGEPSAMYKTMIEVAKARGDAIALIDLREHFSNDEEVLNEIYVNKFSGNTDAQYAAATFPWVKVTTSIKREDEGIEATERYKWTLPGSFGYLMAYSESVKNNANWFAAAGLTRGIVPNLDSPAYDVTEALMNILQGDASYKFNGTSASFIPNTFNVIYKTGIEGTRLWGNKVFWKDSSSVLNTSYLSFLNIRLLLCDIKKQIYHAAMRTTFEPNDDIVWLNFKMLTNTLLDKMKSGRGVKWYKWVKETTKEKATIKARLAIQPIEAVEYFEIDIYMTDDETSVNEVA